MAFSAGGLRPTVEDLYLLDRALAAGRLLSREQQDLMTAPRPEGALYRGGKAGLKALED